MSGPTNTNWLDSSLQSSRFSNMKEYTLGSRYHLKAKVWDVECGDEILVFRVPESVAWRNNLRYGKNYLKARVWDDVPTDTFLCNYSPESAQSGPVQTRETNFLKIPPTGSVQLYRPRFITIKTPNKITEPGMKSWTNNHNLLCLNLTLQPIFVSRMWNF